MKLYLLLSINPNSNGDVCGFFDSNEELKKAVTKLIDEGFSKTLFYETYHTNVIEGKDTWDYCYIPKAISEQELDCLGGVIPERKFFGENLLYINYQETA